MGKRGSKIGSSVPWRSREVRYVPERFMRCWPKAAMLRLSLLQ
jgi:hypothetical protein